MVIAFLQVSIDYLGSPSSSFTLSMCSPLEGDSCQLSIDIVNATTVSASVLEGTSHKMSLIGIISIGGGLILYCELYMTICHVSSYYILMFVYVNISKWCQWCIL